MKKLKYIYLPIIGLLFSASLFAQDNLLEELSAETKEWNSSPVTATFKGTRIINGHSVETRGAKVLEFMISHRFGDISEGIDTFFGLDYSSIRFGLEYSITDKLTVAIGRSSLDKIYDGYLKYRLLVQDKSVPVSITGFASATYTSYEGFKSEIMNISEKHRLNYVYQLLIARKFSDKLSLQLSPTMTHKNLVVNKSDDNTLYALGVGGRYKLSKRLSINAEYFWRINKEENSPYYDAVALGLDIETGGHVFQIQLTNAQSMVEKGFITETPIDFFSGEMNLGFNISRVFNF